MNFEALDGTKLIILMLAGAAFAGVGLYMLLKPRAENAAKIELFGLKFESSSAGLLVFVIGAAFLAVPLFAPEKGSAEGGGLGGAQTPGGKAPAFRLPDDAQVAEQEPNDRAQGGNIIKYGQTVSGDVNGNEADWYIFEMPADRPRDVSLMARHVSGGNLKVELFNGNEYKIGSLSVNAGAQYINSEAGSHAKFFARATQNYGNRIEYELLFSEPPAN